ncbi:uncharacterized protein KY384_007294 [Bacidia gigantensis]|uniref:uncharacterized protein n=1 Tax=Bacidia gigantensis TaxID=2732470 RepID=UPI001D0412AA|nr:uncharacterized protein KY384_007294 [Bacidia gigantensis]KAG8528376.1 hypothetical protein KY384_007294 [Bacidia gigantensis]
MHTNNPPLTSPGPQPLMRKSCHFCRSRKIRCSGQRICNACQDRNIDCIYGREGVKGRPRLQFARSYGRGSNQRLRKAHATGKSHVSTATNTTDSCSSDSSPIASTRSSPFISEEPERNSVTTPNIGAELLFDFLFNGKPTGPSIEFDAASQAFARQASGPTRVSTTRCERPKIAYENVLSVMFDDFVLLTPAKCWNSSQSLTLNDDRPPFIKACLDLDQTISMFDELTKLYNPLQELTDHQTSQLIEIWFSHHPLAFIISKTLHLQRYRNNCHDHALLAIMLADVQFAQNNARAHSKGHELLTWAIADFKRSAQNANGLPKIQTLTLIGWHQLFSGNARRAVAYLLYSRSLLARLPKPALQLHLVNGIDVGGVERELAQNIECLLYSTLTWIFIQCGVSVHTFATPSEMISLPPFDESKSAAHALDLASDNTATLSHQEKTIQSLWPLTHLASTISRLCSLFTYPSIAGVTPSSLTSGSQATQMLETPSLMSLSIPSSDQQNQKDSSKAHAFLSRISSLLKLRLQPHVSRTKLLAAYHTLMIYLLLPGYDGGVRATSALTDEIINRYCVSAGEIIELLNNQSDTPRDGCILLSSRATTSNDALLTGLDACSKAMKYVQDKSLAGSGWASSNSSLSVSELQTIESDLRVMRSQSPELIHLTRQLYEACQDEALQHSSKIISIRDRVKEILQTFESPASMENYNATSETYDLASHSSLEGTFDSIGSTTSTRTPPTPLSAYETRPYQDLTAIQGQFNNTMSGTQSSSSGSALEAFSNGSLTFPNTAALDPRPHEKFEGYMDAFVLDERYIGASATALQNGQGQYCDPAPLENGMYFNML